MDYAVILHEAEEGGYWVDVPSLPGCFSQGESVDEALANVREAIECHLEALRDEGAPLPRSDRWLIAQVAVPVV